MKTAICLTGLPREVSEVWETFRDNLVNQFPNPELFIYTSEPYKVPNEFWNSFNVKAYVVEKQFEHKNLEGFLNNIQCIDINHVRNGIIQQFYGLKRVGEIKRNYEKQFNVKYDLVIRTRPDFIYLRPIKLDFIDIHQINNLHPNFAPTMSTEIAFGPPDLMDHYFGIYDWLMGAGQQYLTRDNPRLNYPADRLYNCDILLISYLIDYLKLPHAPQNLPAEFPSPYDYYHIMSRHKKELY